MQPNLREPFRINTDCSEWALGCELSQRTPENEWKPVAYDGRQLRGAELNYPIHEKELLAIKHALRIFDRYIDNGTLTEIVTDHESLQYLQSTKTYSKRLARWVAEFGEHALKIRYRKGKENVVADTLSRRPDFIGKGSANVAVAAREGPLLAAISDTDGIEWRDAMIMFITKNTPPPFELRKSINDKEANKFEVRKELVNPDNPKGKVQDTLYRKVEGFLVPFLEPEFRKDFVRKMHESYGHLGAPGILGAVRYRAWWSTLTKNFQEYLKRCPNCLASGPSKKRMERELHRHQVQKLRPFERWSIDLVGILPKTPHGNRWIITAVDFATGWPVAKALPDAKATTIAAFLYDLCCMYGVPREILTDLGANFVGKVMEHYLTKLGVAHATTTPYHPRTNGKVENFNGLIGRTLTKLFLKKPIRL